MTKINYNERTFKAESNSEAGEVGSETLFHYRQQGEVVTATYSGGSIVDGHLIASVNDSGELDMRYHHVNIAGELKCGKCHSVPEVLNDGRLCMHETWQWLCDDMSSGQSILIEVK